MNINKWLPILVDPDTKSPLQLRENSLYSTEGRKYTIHNEKPFFLNTLEEEELKSHKDWLNTIKTVFKNKLGRYYTFLVYIISPVYGRVHLKSLTGYFTYLIKTNTQNKDYVVQIGSGNDRISDAILNIDIFDYHEVDMIADCTKLPFADNSIDCLISNAMLEHVANPEVFVKEAIRVLKPGGKIISGVPFIQGFHASPNDYYRWTNKGLIAMHDKFGFKDHLVAPTSGPTSGFLWITQEWLAILLSFNINLLYRFWWFFFTIVLMPVKFLDMLLLHYKNSDKINSFFVYVGTK